MDINDISNLNSAVTKINANISNINSFIENFNTNFNELELKNIDNELIEIKKILDSNNIVIKKSNQNKDQLLNSIDTKLKHFKNFSNDSKI